MGGVRRSSGVRSATKPPIGGSVRRYHPVRWDETAKKPARPRGFWDVMRRCDKGNGGEGGIRTLVPGFPDHPISSRRRYDRFGTSPVQTMIS
ncbi:protein of unknown function [Methylococcus capsulatus]|uniref:Uncharacterized protein n=1 Tax=Methylococcus capsulatus TaxID=414 RepID=A0AA35XT48_METCP|nr:protein of unknown function [Methylococcus capsulatus]